MKVLLLGATGRTGKRVLKFLLQKGYEVNCLVRKKEKVATLLGLKVFEGDVAKKSDLWQAAIGCEVIVNVLNISRTTDFPWSPLRTPRNFLSKVMGNILALESKPKVILCSAWGVAETRNDIPFWFKWLIDYSNIGVAYKDHERQEALLEKSDLDWIIVRPVGLTNFTKIKKVRESINNDPVPSFTISRTTLANYLVDQVPKGELLSKKVVVST